MAHERNRGNKEKRKPKKEPVKGKGVPQTEVRKEGDSTAKQINKHMHDIRSKGE